jgi:DNA modification methylase
MNNVVLLQGNVIEVLKILPDESVQCVVTSPPYYGLRDYGTAKWEGGDPECDHKKLYDMSKSGLEGGKDTQKASLYYKDTCGKCGAIRIDSQIGLEPTPEAYVTKLVEVFREVRRVLRKDGCVFLNLGDSYMGSGGAHKPEHANPGLSRSAYRGGVPHAKTYDTSDKEPVNYQDRDCFCESLCDECRRAYLIGKSHSDNLHASMQFVSPSLTIHEHKESQIAHLPTSDFENQEDHNSNANQDFENLQDLEGERLLSSPASTPGVSFQPLRDECLPKDTLLVCPLCSRSFLPSFQECGCKKVSQSDNHSVSFSTQDQDENKLNKDEIDGALVDHTWDKTFDFFSYPHYTTEYHLKPKDLIGIPWRVAFALQADGWWLRQDIIWAKPNPMPESVTDRCTKAHEYIFILTKSARYYYDTEAVKEQANYPNDKRRPLGSKGAWQIDGRLQGENGGGRPYDHNTSKRNARSVWTITTKPFKGAHFATFPPEIPERCIKAGSKVGDIVLDPFSGAGTVALVAQRLGRKSIGIDLNPEYIKIAEERLAKE